MAENYFLGTVDGVLSTAGNWSLGHAPTTGENVWFVDSTVSVVGEDVSATLWGDVTFGPGHTGNIGSSGSYMIFACQSGKRIIIDGDPDSSSQEMWLDYKSANNVTVDVNSYGPVVASAMASKGIHLKETAAGLLTKVVNNGGKLTLESGTVSTLIDSGSATTVVKSGVSLLVYRCSGSGVVTILNTIPSTSLVVSAGDVTVESSSAIANVIIAGAGIDTKVHWNGGASIGTLLRVDGGTFTTALATRQAVIADAEIYGNSTTTLVDFTNVSLTNDIEVHGSPRIIPPSGSDVAIS